MVKNMKNEEREEEFLRGFAVLLAMYSMGRWVSPPVSLKAMLLQSVPVLTALIAPCIHIRRKAAPWRGLRFILGVFLMSNVVLVAVHLPSVVDMDWWMMQVDMAFVTGLIVCSSSESLLQYTADVSRVQLAWFYFAAGFLKLTKYHSDWRLSCSSIFLSQIAIAWVPAQWMDISRRRDDGAALDVVDISGCNELTIESIISLLRCCHELEMINMSSCDGITDEQIANLMRIYPDLTRIDDGYADSRVIGRRIYSINP